MSSEPPPTVLPSGTPIVRLVRNTLTNGAGTIVAAVLGLLMAPFLINGLGLAGYGVFALALSLTSIGGYAALTDFGVEAAAVRYVALAVGDTDRHSLSRVVSTATVFFVCIAIPLAAGLVACSALLVDAFDITGPLRDEAVVCFMLTAASLVFDLPARAQFALLEGVQRFELFQAVQLIRVVFQFLAFGAVLVFDLGVEGMGGAMLASAVVQYGLAWGLAKIAVRGVRTSPLLVSRALFRELISFGGGMFVIRTTGTIYREMDKAIIGVALGPRSVALYEIANRIHLAAATFQSIASSALTPSTVELRNQPEALRQVFLRGTLFTVALSVPFCVAIFAFAGPLIDTWIGGAANGAIDATRLFVTYLVLVSVSVVGATITVALGRLRPIVIMAVLNLLINVVLSLALVGPLGIEGVILGTVIAQVVLFGFQLRIYLDAIDVRLGRWFREAVRPNLPALAAQGAVSAALVPLAVAADSFPAVAGLMLLSVAVSLATFLRFGLQRDPRRALVATLRSAVRPRARPV